MKVSKSKIKNWKNFKEVFNSLRTQEEKGEFDFKPIKTIVDFQYPNIYGNLNDFHAYCYMNEGVTGGLLLSGVEEGKSDSNSWLGKKISIEKVGSRSLSCYTFDIFSKKVNYKLDFSEMREVKFKTVPNN